MVRVRTEIVECAFDPKPRQQIPPTRDLKSVAVEPAAEIVYLVLLENRVDAADVEPIRAKPGAENGRLVAQLRLVGRRVHDAVPHFVVGGAGGEPISMDIDEREAGSVGAVSILCD